MFKFYRQKQDEELLNYYIFTLLVNNDFKETVWLNKDYEGRLSSLARMQVHPARLAKVSNKKIVDKFK